MAQIDEFQPHTCMSTRLQPCRYRLPRRTPKTEKCFNLGQVGAGKSTVANAIFRTGFHVSSLPNSVHRHVLNYVIFKSSRMA